MINVIFMGRKKVGALCLEWLAAQDGVVIPAVATDAHLSISPVREVAERLSIPVLSRTEIEERILQRTLKSHACLSVLFWQKIRWPIISHSSRGVINFHPAPLPEYKGTAGYNLAILEARADWAVSAHYVVDETFDTGPIIDISSFDVDVNTETAQSLETKSQTRIFEQFKLVVQRVIATEQLLPTTPNLGGKYTTRTQMEAMKEIAPGDDVDRKIRAFWFPPYMGAFVRLGGRQYTLINEQLLRDLAPKGASSLFCPTAETEC